MAAGGQNDEPGMGRASAVADVPAGHRALLVFWPGSKPVAHHEVAAQIVCRRT